MRNGLRLCLATGLALIGVTTAVSSASAAEHLLTLHSPPIVTEPYVHTTHYIHLAADGREAPATPGYITGWKEQVLVTSTDPKAKPLSNAKFMIHHFVIFAPRREHQLDGGCWGQLGFIGGRGEEHPNGQFGRLFPADVRSKYGVLNRTADGTAPDWTLLAMVMNHVKHKQTVYVRLKIWYTDEPRTEMNPLVVGDCSKLPNQMAYDVPGGGGKGSNFVNETRWTSPVSGRILAAASHQHGGAKYQSLTSLTCGRQLFKARAYYGTPDNIYNTIRPILHEPGPIANGTFGSRQGVPISKGEVFERAAVHDNSNLHVASMGFFALMVVPDDSVGRCDPMPTDIREMTKPKRYAKHPNYGLVVPQLSPPRSPAFEAMGSDPASVGDYFFSPGKLTTTVGVPITWDFGGTQPHTVTVANGPRGFSSLYTGHTNGSYTFTPTVPGTYRLTCLVHPTTMGETVVVS